MKKNIITDQVKNIMGKVEETGGTVFLVGGAIRNFILKKEINDYDIVCNLTENELKTIFPNIVQYSSDTHKTFRLNENDTIIEITLSNFLDSSILEDLNHRDFTINAIACSINNEMIDPYLGVLDLKNKVLKAVRNPMMRFLEDPLRILRAIRISSLYGLKIEEETKNKMFLFKHKLNIIPKERIRDEFCKIMLLPNLKKILLEYREIFAVFIPELKNTFNLKQNNKYHKHDVYEHMATVAAYTEPILLLRISGLLHDIGKPDCYTEEIKNGIVHGHFYGHPEKSKEISKEILKRLKFSNKFIIQALFLIENHDIEFSLTEKSIGKVLNKINNAKLESSIFDDLLKIKISDRKDHLVPQNTIIKEKYMVNEKNYSNYIVIYNKIINEKQCFSLKKLNFNGYDALSLGFEGKEIKKILNKLLNLVIDGKIENNKNILISYVVNILE